jgi:hypothetical protein
LDTLQGGIWIESMPIREWNEYDKYEISLVARISNIEWMGVYQENENMEICEETSKNLGRYNHRQNFGPISWKHINAAPFPQLF